MANTSELQVFIDLYEDVLRPLLGALGNFFQQHPQMLAVVGIMIAFFVVWSCIMKHFKRMVCYLMIFCVLLIRSDTLWQLFNRLLCELAQLRPCLQQVLQELLN